jgi:hypothetical protein
MVMILVMATAKQTWSMSLNFDIGVFRRLDRRSWLVIGGLAIVAIVTLLHGVVALNASRNPDLALQIDPGNAQANELRAEEALAQSDPTTAVAAARTALVRNPAQAGAVRSLGLAASLIVKQDAALAAFQYADRLSRRDLGTNLWLIEFAVSKNDLTGALSRYDITLRTSSSAYKTLFPILAITLEDPDYVPPVTRLLATKPPWAFSFIEYVFNTKLAPQNLDRLARAMSQNSAPLEQYLERVIIERLAISGDYEAAWHAYLRLRPEAGNKRGIRDSTLENESPPSLFDWQYVATGNAAALPRHKGRAMVFRSFNAEPVPLLSQLLLLAPGSYAIAGQVRITTGDSLPYWKLTCVIGERVLGQTGASTSSVPTVFASVDLSCPAQWLRLIIPGSPNVTTEGTLQSVNLINLSQKSQP